MSDALQSLLDIDENYPVPLVGSFLAQPENHAFLEYVYKDPFGCHVFPGDIVDYPLGNFFPTWKVTLKRRVKFIYGLTFQLVAIVVTSVSTRR